VANKYGNLPVGSDEEKYNMKKLFLTLMLVVLSSNAMAEWVEIGATDNSTLYFDSNTIRKSGNKVKMWSLSDFNSVEEVSGDKFLSEMPR